MTTQLPISFSEIIASIPQIPYLIMVSIATVVALVCASTHYIIGRIGGVSLLKKIKSRYPHTAHKIDDVCQWFEAYGAVAVLIIRLVPLCRTYISFIAGAVKLNYVTFITSSFIGVTLWNAILIGVAYLFYHQLINIYILYTHYKHTIVLLFVLVLFLWIYRFYLSHKTHSTNDN